MKVVVAGRCVDIDKRCRDVLGGGGFRQYSIFGTQGSEGGGGGHCSVRKVHQKGWLPI